MHRQHILLCIAIHSWLLRPAVSSAGSRLSGYRLTFLFLIVGLPMAGRLVAAAFTTVSVKYKYK